MTNKMTTILLLTFLSACSGMDDPGNEITGSESTTILMESSSSNSSSTKTTLEEEFCSDGELNNLEECELSDNCTPECRKNICGDGFILENEFCDDGENNGIYSFCKENCDGITFCGDGILDLEEECDKGLNNGVVGSFCSNFCKNTSVCGDKIQDSSNNESCDDGNLNNDDNCTSDCKIILRVFATSFLYKGYALGGIKGATEKCKFVATQSKFRSIRDKSENFVAWISNDEYDVKEILGYKGELISYRLINDVEIASGWSDLTDGELKFPIAWDENTDVIVDNENDPLQTWNVWSNTKYSGIKLSNDCSDWKSINEKGSIGNILLINNGGWSNNTLLDCGDKAHLYCIENYNI